MLEELFADSYKVHPSDSLPFKGAWCGPEKLDAYVFTLVASYEHSGSAIGEVYCAAAPARFYRVSMVRVVNDEREMVLQLSTGSGEESAKMVAFLAECFASGDVEPAKKEDVSLGETGKIEVHLEEKKGNDGHGVDLCKLPHGENDYKYFLIAHDGTNSVGESEQGFALSFSGVLLSEIEHIAKQINDGMLGLA